MCKLVTLFQSYGADFSVTEGRKGYQPQAAEEHCSQGESKISKDV